MKSRIFALFASVALSGSLLSVAQAGPTPSVSVSLVCDRGIGSSEAVVDFYSGFGGTLITTATLSCGPDSFSGLRADRRKVFGSIGAIQYGSWKINAVVSGGCVGGSTVPDKIVCQVNGAGPAVTLTVR